MNAALLSSKKMDYCTPQDFFDRLNEEFHFTLDAAATDKSAKCPGVLHPGNRRTEKPVESCGGGLYSATLHTGARLGNGFAKPTRKPSAAQPSFF